MRLSSAFVFALVLLIWVPVAVGEEEPENIIKNGGFEFQFQDWLFWTEGGAVAERQAVSKKVEPISVMAAVASIISSFTKGHLH